MFAGESLAGHASDLGADHLDRAHQRVGEEQRPDQAEAELSSRLRIGCDSTRVVVGSAGDEAGAEDVGKTRPIGLFDLIGGWAFDCCQCQALCVL